MRSIKMTFQQAVVISGFLLFFSSCDAPQSRKEGNRDTFSFAFLTDVHVQPERNADKGFMQAMDKVNQLAPDFVIMGGDQIMDALSQSEARADSLYDMYVALSRHMNMPVYNTMGNHEVFGINEISGVDPSHPLYGEKMYEERIGKRYYAFDHKGWRFYILDSVDEKDDRQGYYGHIDSMQIEWLKKDLEQVGKNTPIAISIHIPFISVPAPILISCMKLLHNFRYCHSRKIAD